MHLTSSGNDVCSSSGAFICINCGFGTKTLYNRYKGGIIKIPLCENCGKSVDKYVEYDLVIISLDVLLLKRQAFRHILVNSNIRSPWKFGLLLLLCEAFTKLLQQKPVEGTVDTMPDYVIYSALEADLYWNFLVAVFELLALLFGMLVWIWIWKFIQKEMNWPSVYDFTCGVLLSNFAKILVLPALLWGGQYSGIYVWLSLLFTVGANIQAIRVLCPSLNMLSIAAGVLVGHGLAHASVNHLLPLKWLVI